LIDLSGAPKIVKETFEVSKTLITSFKGLPADATYKWFNANECQNLTSLRGLVASVHGMELNGNPKLTSLEGIGTKWLKSCERLEVKSQINSHVLGILKIKGLKQLVTASYNFEGNEVWAVIIKKYLKDGKTEAQDIFDCQNELIDAGLDDYAQL
jgi:hypothetical protein